MSIGSPVALAVLRRSEHVLFAVLLTIGIAGTVDMPRAKLLTVAAVSVAGWYWAGIKLAERHQRQALALSWLVILTAGCAALALASASFVWLAFPLYLLFAQLLPPSTSIPAVAAVAAGTIAVIATDRGRLDAAAVVGPLVGAAVALVITAVYRDLTEQVRQRADLIERLTAAQDQLAATQRHAGMLAERERLSREIHDTITQSLTSIVLVLRTARRSEPTGSLQAQLDTAIAAASTALADTRRLVHDLTPAELAASSLPDALRQVTTSQPGLHTQLQVKGQPGAVPTPVAVALLRAAQEALANVRAHAHANRADVTLTYQPDAISLDIADDGTGFDAGQPFGPTTGTGLGIPGIRARAAQVGGTVSIYSAPGRGTSLNITVPRKENRP